MFCLIIEEVQYLCEGLFLQIMFLPYLFSQKCRKKLCRPRLECSRGEARVSRGLLCSFMLANILVDRVVEFRLV